MAEDNKLSGTIGFNLDDGDPAYAGGEKLPTFYVDAVHRPISISNNARVVFARYDYNIHAKPGENLSDNIKVFPVVQLVMSFDGLVAVTDQLNKVLSAAILNNPELGILAEKLRALSQTVAEKAKAERNSSEDPSGEA